MAYDKDKIKELITLDNAFTLLEYYGAEPIDNHDHIVAKTVCHGGHSHKLFCYDNEESGLLFKCYTQCQDGFDIFELVQKIEGVDLNSAVNFVAEFFNLQHFDVGVEQNLLTDDWKKFSRWAEIDSIDVSDKRITLPEYPNVIKHFPQPRILDWEKDHISKEVCDYMGIRYNPLNGSIIIPHNDKYGRLVGIRQRTLVKDDEIYGKYRPMNRLDNPKKTYNHPLGFNLYGLDKAKDRIAGLGVAMVFEAEKSVLAAMSYLGTSNNIAVAMCGSTLSSYQFELLLECGAKEVCICIDRDYEKIGDEVYNRALMRMNKMFDKYSPDANISFIFDTHGLTGYKHSPTDDGKDVFLKLWNERF